MLYACDGEWWDAHHEKASAGFAGELWTQDPQAWKRHHVNRVEGAHEPGLGRSRIHFGGNSGYQAVNLAFLRGARRIVLLGFDMQRGPAGESHWHGDHPGGLNRSLPVHAWLDAFPQLALDLAREGVRVLNASRQTALDCFVQVPLEVALCD